MREKLGNLYKVSSGGTPLKSNREYYEEGTIKWVKTGDLKQQYLYNTEDCITEAGLNKSSARMYEENTVLIAMYGATIGATSILKIPACTNQACAAFPPIDSVIPEYLYYFLRSKKSQFVKDGVGGAQPNISGSYLKDVEIDLLDLKEQKKIVNILDKSRNIFLSRDQQIQQLDNLIKSRFVEMFGDPVSNPMGWRKTSCKDITSKIGSGATPRGGNESYKEEGISLIRSMNVFNDRFEYNDLAYIDEEQAEKLSNVTIKDNDVLLNITGASVARCCVVPKDIIPARVNQHVSILRFKEDIIPVFMSQHFTNGNYQKLLWNLATSGGATREAITKKQIEEMEVIVPPTDLQNQFAAFVQQVDKLKVEVQNSLQETQLLFDALMQKYFA